MNFDAFRDPADPMAVIRDSKEGCKRVRALECLKEPLANGGTQKEQDLVVSVLCYCAAKDSLAPCRMAAIDTMRKFKDVRVVEGLKDAYYGASKLAAGVVHGGAYAGAGGTGRYRQPGGRGHPGSSPARAGDSGARCRSSAENQREDRRRPEPLGKFKQYQSTAALAEVLKSEDDVALRKRAHESLVSATGHDLPPDGAVWQEFLNNPANKDSIGREPTWGERVLQLTGWKSD